MKKACLSTGLKRDLLLICRPFALISFLAIATATKSLAQVITNWVGSVSADYFNKYNWSDTNINFTMLTGTTLLIGAGSPNNCILKGGNSSNINYRPGYLNTLSGGTFIVNGAVFPNNSDSLNGTITLNSPANLNIRNIVYIGSKANALAGRTHESFTPFLH